MNRQKVRIVNALMIAGVLATLSVVFSPLSLAQTSTQGSKTDDRGSKIEDRESAPSAIRNAQSPKSADDESGSEHREQKGRTDVFVPLPGSAVEGEGGAWSGSLWVRNLDSSPANVQFFLFKLNQPNPTPEVYNDNLAAGEARRYDRAAVELFSETRACVVRVLSDQRLIVRSVLEPVPGSALRAPDSRLVTSVPLRTPDGGLQPPDLRPRSEVEDLVRTLVAAVPASFAISAGQKTKLLGAYPSGLLTELRASGYGLQATGPGPQTSDSARAFRFGPRTPDFRAFPTGLVETAGDTVGVRVTAFDETGKVVVSKDYTLAAFEPQQYDLGDFLSGANANKVKLEVEVLSGGGKVIAFGSGIGKEAAAPEKVHTGPQDEATGEGGMGASKAGEKVGSTNLSSLPEKTAQGSSLTGSGSSGQITMWTNANTLGNSVITQGTNGNVHIGSRPANTNTRLWVTGDGASGAIVGLNEGGGEGTTAVTGFGRGGKGVYGDSTGAGIGVEGFSVSGPGVKGQSESGRGVEGRSKTSSGVLGESEGGPGVAGRGLGAKATFGVLGRAEEGAIAGVHGLGTANANGIQGEAEGGGRGVYGKAKSGVAVYGESVGGRGIEGHSKEQTGVVGFSDQGHGVSGESPKTFGVLGRGIEGALAGVHGRGDTGEIDGVQGQANGSGRGVYGKATSGDGVYGESASGRGVHGKSNGSGDGVFGESNSGRALYGKSSGSGDGVFGEGVSGPGVHGKSSGSGAGVFGEGMSGPGVHGKSSGGGPGVKAESTSGSGVEATSASNTGVEGNSTGGVGVAGISKSNSGVEGQSSSGAGVKGASTSGPGVKGTSASSIGVEGISTSFTGVRGESTSATGVLGTSKSGAGIFGESDGDVGIHGKGDTRGGVKGESKSGIGVFGSSESNSGVEGSSKSRVAVRGASEFLAVAGFGGMAGRGVQGSSDNEIGVWGISKTNFGARGASDSSVGVAGFSKTSFGVQGSSDSGIGVIGFSKSEAGIQGQSDERAGARGLSEKAVGVYGQSTGNSGGWFVTGNRAAYGVVAGCLEGVPNCRAGLFSGSLQATGKFFHIDHPLDPANKYLNHASIESSELKNLYDGIAVLDSLGEAVVTLPDWFEALNKSFRYQLTSLGLPGPNLYIAEEIKNNRFKVAGGTPGTKVSWLVTGLRQDAWVKANPMVVEEEKLGIEKGYYLNPELFGQSKDKSVLRLHNSDLSESMTQKKSLSSERDSAVMRLKGELPR